MFEGPRRAAPVRGAVLCVCLWALAGCGDTDPLTRAGVSLQPPTGWKPVGRKTWAVPGTPLAAWSGPGGASLVVFRSLPDPGRRAGSLAEATAHRLEHLPGVRVAARGTVAAGGVEAARVVAVGPGTGAAFAPSGTGVPLLPGGRSPVPTRRVVVSLRRPEDTLSLVWHAPEGRAGPLDAAVRQTLETLAIRRVRRPSSSY